MTRTAAITRAEKQFDSGEFRAMLARRIAIPTESQNPERGAVLAQYLDDELQPAFEAMGFECRMLTHPKAKAPWDTEGLRSPGGQVYSKAGMMTWPAANAIYRRETYDLSLIHI